MIYVTIVYSLATGDIVFARTKMFSGKLPSGCGARELLVSQSVVKYPHKYRVTKKGIELKIVGNLVSV